MSCSHILCNNIQPGILGCVCVCVCDENNLKLNKTNTRQTGVGEENLHAESKPSDH